MKKILFTSLIIVVVSCVIFVPVYLLLIHTASTNVVDYSADIQGKWNAYQYYYDKDRVVCNDEIWMTLEIVDDEITIKGTVLQEVNCNFNWLNGTSLSYSFGEENTTFYLSIDENDNLKITIAEDSYIILLRRAEG